MDSIYEVAMQLSNGIEQTMSSILPGEKLKSILLVLFNGING